MSVPTFGDQRLPQRFWTKVNVDPVTGCWEWTAAISNGGYGVFSFDKRPQKAHRVAYLTLVGPIADNFQLDHLCRNRKCVNPSHLEPVSLAINVLRGLKGYELRGVCVNGHDITADDAIYCPTQHPTRRDCAECRRIRALRQRTLIRAAHEALGISQSQYRATYGHSIKTAVRVLSTLVYPIPAIAMELAK